MILNLVIKDIKAYWETIFLRLMLPYILIGVLFSLRHYSWDVYMMLGYIIITAACSFFLFSDKKRNMEMLFCSLPVTRSDIVLARYLTSVVIIVVGFSFMYLNGYIASLINTNTVMDFSQTSNPKALFIVLFSFSIYLSIFLPSVFMFRVFGMTMTLISALTAVNVSIPLIFHPYSPSFSPQFEASDFPQSFFTFHYYDSNTLHFSSVIIENI